MRHFSLKREKNIWQNEIYNIGDSSRAGRVLEAVRGAYHLAVRI